MDECPDPGFNLCRCDPAMIPGHNCIASCTNTEGSFACSCSSGYSIEVDLLTCIGTCKGGKATAIWSDLLTARALLFDYLSTYLSLEPIENSPASLQTLMNASWAPTLVTVVHWQAAQHSVPTPTAPTPAAALWALNLVPMV